MSRQPLHASLHLYFSYIYRPEMFTIDSRRLNSPLIVFTYFLNVEKKEPNQLKNKLKRLRSPERLLSLDTGRSSLWRNANPYDMSHKYFPPRFSALPKRRGKCLSYIMKEEEGVKVVETFVRINSNCLLEKKRKRVLAKAPRSFERNELLEYLMYIHDFGFRQCGK